MIRIKSLDPLNSSAMSNSIEFYLKSIDRRWKKEIRQTNNEILLLSPYMTSKTAELIIETINNKDLCKIYTVFSLENFMMGHSSIKTINNLSQRGYKLFHLHRLNANIILILHSFVSIGSQSLNRKGVKNKEANIIITDPKKIQKIYSIIQSWVSSGCIISQEMIDETEQELFSLRRKFCSLQRESADLEIQIRDHENQRRQQFILETMIKIFHIISELTEFINEEIDSINKRQKILNDPILKSKIASGREKVLKIANHQSIDRSLAEKCIKESAYWYDHPCGHPVKAPKHSHRIRGNTNNWYIDFGANTFLVGHAICRCQVRLLKLLDNIENGCIIPIKELREQLKHDVRRAVANYDGYEYGGSYSGGYGKYMKFGAQAINLDEFINVVLRTASLGFIFEYLRNQYPQYEI